jgi:Tfp pilus assembly protein PilO
MERSPTHTIVIIASSLVAIAAAGIWGFLGYKSETYRAESIGIAQEIADASVQSQRSLSLKASFDRARASVADVVNDFTPESQIPDFIGTLETAARNRSVALDIGSINLGGDPADAGPRPLSLRLTGSCSWKNCVSFVSDLDTLHYAIDIRDVSLTAGGKGAWRLSVDMVQYVIK